MSAGTATALVVARRVGIVACFVLILLRPGYGEVPVRTQVADVEVLVALDRTRSMAALDHPPADTDQNRDQDEDQGRAGGAEGAGRPRIVGAQEDLQALFEQLPAARYGLMTFGFDVQMELPFTTDGLAFTTAVDTVLVEPPSGGVGSSVDRPLSDLVDVLTRSAEQYPDRRRILVFVSDGERTASGQARSMREVAPLIDGGVVLGYGTRDGARMPAADDLSDADGFVIDPATGEPAVSRADPDALSRLADELGVPYRARSAAELTGGAGIEEIVADFDASYAGSEEIAGSRAAHDLTWIPGLVLLVLALGELRSGWQAAWTARTGWTRRTRRRR